MGIVALIFERFWEYRRCRLMWVISIVAASINLVPILLARFYGWDPAFTVWGMMTGLWIMVVFVLAQRLLAHERDGER